MKRWIAMLMVVVVLSISGTTVMAANGVELSMEGPETCAPGSKLTISFVVPKDTNMCAADFRVGFDTDDFKVNEYKAGELLNGFMNITNDNFGGQFALSAVSTTPLTQGGSLFTIEFQVDAEASGKHKFTFFTTSFANYDGEAIPTVGGEYTVKVTGEAVSKETVEPVLGENGKSVKAQDKPLAIASSVSATDLYGNTEDGELGVGTIIAIVGGSVVLVAALAALVLWFMRRSKQQPEPQEEYVSVLDSQLQEQEDIVILPPESDDE